MQNPLIEVDVAGVTPIEGGFSGDYLFSIGIIPYNNAAPNVGVVEGACGKEHSTKH